MEKKSFDVVIVGAGIVGLTVAHQIKLRAPSTSVAILEKEESPGLHASGRNSGVLHCGIYYGADTLKARACSVGAKRMMAFAEEHGIPFSKSGKVIIATKENQLPAIQRLLENAKENQINARKISPQELREIEPNAADGPAAIYCPDTAVIDIHKVLQTLRGLLERSGVEFIFGCKVELKQDGKELNTSIGKIGYGFLFNCAGAHADKVAKSFGLAGDYTLVPFKGIYWKLNQGANHLVRSSIYPVPDISLPFLGVHLTRVMSGDVYIGPTAIPALGRENYGLLEGINMGEALSIGKKLAAMYLANQNNFRLLARTEIAKYRKTNFLSAAKELMPCLENTHMIPTPKVGIRPQLINQKTNKLEMDYIFEKTENSLHVLNAISPAFTSSFAFAEMIVDEAGVLNKIEGMKT
jgi:L-2-hydroxyglutarate oxidase LhgO